MTDSETFTLDAELKENTVNGKHYERFTTMDYHGEEFVVPFRPGIVAEYLENHIGYLIQETEDGFIWIGVEFGEEDDFGPLVPGLAAALQGAVVNWTKYGARASSWSEQLVKDAMEAANS